MADLSYAVQSSERPFSGRIISVRVDEVTMPDGSTSSRDVVEHPGAVGVVALRDDGAVHLVRQFRHPVRAYLEELPAGLLDVDGEPALSAARRELAEEAGLQADDWRVLADVRPSPGASDEAVRVYLARGVRELPGGRPPAEHEEQDMTGRWVPLDDAVAEVLGGRITNALAVVGLLAARTALRDAAPLREAEAPWDARPGR